MGKKKKTPASCLTHCFIQLKLCFGWNRPNQTRTEWNPTSAVFLQLFESSSTYLVGSCGICHHSNLSHPRFYPENQSGFFFFKTSAVHFAFLFRSSDQCDSFCSRVSHLNLQFLLGGPSWSRDQTANMLAPQSCLTVMAVLMGAVPLHLAFPSGQTWFIHHSGQVARPVMINSSPVSDEFPIPRFVLPEQTASRRQDGPFQASGSNNLQNEAPVHVKPGDKVSLIVRNQNPLEAQKFVDVGALLMDLQRMPPASDGSYHVFLAPPNYPQPTGGQKFDVTYVGAPQREQQTTLGGASDPRNPHPPLFVAPLDYSVPQGYGRVQIPIQNVKFALNSPFQQVQQQPAQFQQPQQQFRQPQPQFQPTQQPIQPVQFQQPQPVQFQQPQPVQFQQPQVVHIQPPQLQPVQFQTPQPPQFQTPQPVQFQPQFQPPQPQFQPIPAQQPQFQPQFQKQTVVSEFQRPQFQQPPPPSSFEQSLSDIRLQTGFVPFQTLEETSTPPPVTQPAPPPPPPTQPAPPPAPKEPLVLAVESPEFLELINPRPAPKVVEVVRQNAPVSEIPQPATQSPVVVPPEEKVAAVVELKPVSSPAIIPASLESAPEVPANTVSTLIPPPQEDAPLPAPTPAFEQTIPAATPIPAPEISGVTETTQTRPLKKRPINRIPLEGGVPQWPDFQAVRQRQQLQRQQNRKKITPSSGNNFEPILSQTQPEAPVDPTSFGQKIRNKVKTNSLVSPPLPVPVEPQVVVEQPKAQSFVVEPAAVEQTQHDSFDLDPPVVERDESFQTLESQNAASGNQRGRIRFNRPNSLNVIPAEPSTVPPVRQTVSTLVGGRGRIRINSNSFTTPAPTTAGPTAAATEASTAAPTTVQTPAPTVAATTASTTPESTTVAATVPTVAPTASRLVDPVVTEGPALEEEIVRGDSPIALVEENVPVAEEEEDVPLEEEEEEEQAISEGEKSVFEPAEKPWSPYEAIQRQRETVSQVVSSNDQPLRIRGKTTFSSSRIPLPPVRPEVGNRPVVLRPAASIRRPLPPTVRITKPIFDIQGQENIRSQEDFIAPQSLEFGIRDGVESKPILINNSPAQFLLPVGRRVPETRPGIQNIRIGRPTTQAPTTTTTTEAPVEEEPVDAFQQEADELVTDEPLANDQLLPEEEEEGEGELVEEEVEEEILTDEVEGEENEEFVETVDETEPVVSSTAAPTVTTAEAFSEVVEEQEEAELDQGVVEETNKSPVEQPITTTTEAPVVIEESIVPAEGEVEEEGAIELAAGNHVDDQSNPSESSDDERQVLGVSTATEVSLMYELCYRGRCVRVHE